MELLVVRAAPGSPMMLLGSILGSLYIGDGAGEALGVGVAAGGTLGEGAARGGILGDGGVIGSTLQGTRGSVAAEAVRGDPGEGVAVVDAGGMV